MVKLSTFQQEGAPMLYIVIGVNLLLSLLFFIQAHLRGSFYVLGIGLMIESLILVVPELLLKNATVYVLLIIVITLNFIGSFIYNKTSYATHKLFSFYLLLEGLYFLTKLITL